MLGDFTFYNPTRIHFGKNALDRLPEELAGCGPVVQLVSGLGSARKSGLYDKVTTMLAGAGKRIVDDPGVMPNPTMERVLQGCALARENNVDLILSVGGGSCCDYAKFVAASVWLDNADPWDFYVMRRCQPPAGQKIPAVGCIMTMAGTGSEMNATAVITNKALGVKHSAKFGARLNPRFSIFNPEYTMTLPHKQMVAGIFDIFCHLCEQYFSGDDDNTSDYMNEGLMRSLLPAAKCALHDPMDYEARSNIAWTATMALNGLLRLGKKGDGMVHKIGHAVSTFTDATHGMSLSAVAMPYYKFMVPFGLHKFARFAVNIWNVDPAGLHATEVALRGLSSMEDWMRNLGLVMNLRDLGVVPDMLDSIASRVIIIDGGWKKLNHTELCGILESALDY